MRKIVWCDIVKRASLLFVFLCLLFSGCAKKHTPQSSTGPEQKLQTICSDELHLSCGLFAAGKTLWVYVPVKKRFFDLRANGEPIVKTPAAAREMTLKFIKGDFAERNFVFSYDARDEVDYPKTLGYGTTYTNSYMVLRQGVLSSINRAYGDQDTAASGTAPTFVMVVLTDIERGLEARILMNLDDLKRGMSDPGFQEEFAMRMINEPLTGSKKMIGDKAGRHLQTKDILWPEFLTKQTVYRVEFQYHQNKIKPTGPVDDVVLKAMYETLSAYGFTDFDEVRLKNLENGKERDVKRGEILDTSLP